MGRGVKAWRGGDGGQWHALRGAGRFMNLSSALGRQCDLDVPASLLLTLMLTQFLTVSIDSISMQL